MIRSSVAEPVCCSSDSNFGKVSALVPNQIRNQIQIIFSTLEIFVYKTLPLMLEAPLIASSVDT
jgi:hypothetical protein